MNETSRSERRFAAAVALVLAAMVSTPAESFKPAIHESITQDALERYEISLSNGRKVRFTQAAIDEIRSGNVSVDHSETFLLAAPHFDNESFAAGVERLRRLRLNVKSLFVDDSFAAALVAARLEDKAEVARLTLGQSLHSVQDFYSHSTWVERGNRVVLPVEDVASIPPSASRSCSDGTSILSGGPLTSGYFDIGIFFQLNLESLIRDGKCIHGLGGLQADLGSGIHKDEGTRVGHAWALRLATQASVSFLTDVVADLAATRRDELLCAFAGQSNDVCGLTPSGPRAIAAGVEHTCAVTALGGVRCWGSNAQGQLGNGTFVGSATPVDVTGLTSGVVAVSAGHYYTCALTDTGAVRCWGMNHVGQLGDGTQLTRTTPVAVTGLSSGVAAVSGGAAHACALLNSGAVRCWGWNGSGELGNNDPFGALQATPVDVVGLTGAVKAISVGGLHSCALLSSGAIQCWGSNGAGGQLGDGTAVDRRIPVNVVGLPGSARAVSAAGGHTCAAMTDGTAWCWGNGGNGRLGDGTGASSFTPVAVQGLVDAASTEAFAHSCALRTSGGIRCWGLNAFGQLGDGTFTDRFAPVDVIGLDSRAIALAVGDAHTCAITTAGHVQCWGHNDRGQLGNGSIVTSATPVLVSGF